MIPNSLKGGDVNSYINLKCVFVLAWVCTHKHYYYKSEEFNLVIRASLVYAHVEMSGA